MKCMECRSRYETGLIANPELLDGLKAVCDYESLIQLSVFDMQIIFNTVVGFTNAVS